MAVGPRRRLFLALDRPALVVSVAVVAIIAAANVCVQLAAESREVSPANVPAGATVLVFGAKVSGGEPGEYVLSRLDAAAGLYRSGRVTMILNSGNGLSRYGSETV